MNYRKKVHVSLLLEHMISYVKKACMEFVRLAIDYTYHCTPQT